MLRWFGHLKPIDRFNMVTASLAFLLSAYTFVTGQISAWNAQSVATNRMLFGAYTLGFDYAHLVLCTQPDKYVACTHLTSGWDFAKLDPIAAGLLGSPVNWPALRPSSEMKLPLSYASDPVGDRNIISAALTAHYEDSRVDSAFVLGEAIAWLFYLDKDPTTVVDPALSNVRTCRDKAIDPDIIPPKIKDTNDLNICLSGAWSPPTPTPSSPPSHSP
jgi:hypothetical protein